MPHGPLIELVPHPSPEAAQARAGAARALVRAAPLLMAAHAVAASLAAGAFALAGDAAAAAAALLIGGGLLAADLLGWLLVRGRSKARVAPLPLLRGAAAWALLSSLILILFAGLAPEPVAQAAIFAGLFCAALAFLPAPASVILIGLAACAGIAWAGLSWTYLPVAAATAAALAGASVRGWGERIEAAARLLGEQEKASKARFAAEYEQSGQGWFWETDAEGNLTYVSERLARAFGRPVERLTGRALPDLFTSEGEDDSGVLRTERTVPFYLSARMPFSEVTVRGSNAAEDGWWSLTGRPLFDEGGAFLGFRGIGTDLSERKRAEAELWRLARYDSLTGLPNRSHMLRTLEAAFRNAVPGREGCSLFLLDLDRFKSVNDTQGHLAGDELLCQVAKRLGEVIGKLGQVGRLGGDEFKIVLPKMEDKAALTELAERCISYLGIPYRINGRTFSIGASIGIAVVEPGDQSAEELVRRADLALYAAKDGGRGTFRFFDPEMQEVVRDRQVLEHDLKQAIANGELSLFFQPSVNTATEELAGFEALVRWDHPVQGYIPPASFVPIAEESGLIVRMGEWIIRAACAEAAKWPAGVNVAVNLSPVQFTNPNLPAVIVNALAAAQLPASRLELEITESVFLSQDPKTDEIFAKLKSLGVRLALDDFGTGYSSFGYLKKAPFDKIKIDQSFVRGATAPESRNKTILKAIVEMADGLGMDTTAEGAETQDELELVRELGCSHVQGFVFGRPMPAEEACRLASEQASLSATGFVFSRQARQRLIRTGMIHAPGGAFPILVRNISEGGALIECGQPLGEGAEVELEMAGCGRIPGEVRWSQGNRIGLRFAHPFATASLLPNANSRPATEMLTPDYIRGGEYLKKDKAAGIG